MKKFMLPLLAMIAVPAFASNIEFSNLSKNQVKDVTTEFAANFAHTTVSAPETNGLWGVEVGVVGGATGTPKLKDAVNDAGGSGSDFKSLYHAGVFGRAHFPFDLYAELNVLPQRKISDVNVSNRSMEVGWNVGGFVGLPLDVSIAYNAANSAIDFKQQIGALPNESKIAVDAKTRILYVGVSKTFLFVTPYAKFGTAKQDSTLKTTGGGTVLGYSSDTKEDVSKSGGYVAFGANLQLAFFKLGFEWGQIMGVRRASGKISLDF